MFHDGVLTLRSANAPRTAWTGSSNWARTRWSSAAVTAMSTREWNGRLSVTSKLPASAPPAATAIPVRVTDLSYLGDVMQVHLATNWNQDLDIRLPLRPGALPDWQVGSQGHLAWVNAHSQVHAAA